MHIVVATEDKKMLNGHFAIARYFLFYDITEQSCELVNEMEFLQDDATATEQKPLGIRPFRIDERIAAIEGTDVIFVSAIGGPIADRVIATKVYPIEMNAPEPIDMSLAKLQALMKGKKPLWLQRILNHDFMLEGN